MKTQLYDKRGTSHFSIAHMPHLDSNNPSNIYYASIDSKMLRFARSTLDINTFVTLSNHILTRMQKQGSKHRSIIFKLNKIFGKHFTVFNIFADTAANFIKLFSLHWIRNIHIEICLHSLFLLLFFTCLFVWILFACSFVFVCLFVCLCGYHVITASVSSIFLSMHYVCSYGLVFCNIILL